MLGFATPRCRSLRNKTSQARVTLAPRPETTFPIQEHYLLLQPHLHLVVMSLHSFLDSASSQGYHSTKLNVRKESHWSYFPIVSIVLSAASSRSFDLKWKSRNLDLDIEIELTLISYIFLYNEHRISTRSAFNILWLLVAPDDFFS